MKSVSFRIKPKRLFLKKNAMENFFANIRITKIVEGTHPALPLK